MIWVLYFPLHKYEKREQNLYLPPYLQVSQKRWRRRPSIEAGLCPAVCHRKWSKASYKVSRGVRYLAIAPF
jgi:hypothetical protein